MIIAVDGPAAAGKGTLARRLAAHLGFAYLDSGKLYRAVGLAVLRGGGDPASPVAAIGAARWFAAGDLDNPELTGEVAAGAATKVAAIPDVRAALLAFQRGFAAHPPDGKAGAVIDGRDIGTVVCPDAARKLFVTASIEVRAERRCKELRDRGEEAIYARVLQEMRERDARDSQRSVAPLKAADDAFLLDTSELDADQAYAAALRFITSEG